MSGQVGFYQWSQAVEKVTEILKRKFPNLTVAETLKLAHEIVQSVLVIE